MAALITLIAEVDGVVASPASTTSGGFRMRPSNESDLQQLGSLYFDPYEPGVACDTLDEAIDDIQGSFDGEYGVFWLTRRQWSQRTATR